jgi:hypothetical protein
MKTIVRLCSLLFTCFCIALAQQVEVTNDGQHVLHLNSAQQSAVDAFMKVHPELKLVSCPTVGPDSGWCKTAYTNWEVVVQGQNATPQFPTAAWGDFRGKGVIDFALAFHSEKAGNSIGGRQAEIVIFENVGGDEYRPEVVVTDAWGGCLDGMLFHPARKRLEFWCNTVSGYAKWNGTKFVGKTSIGD